MSPAPGTICTVRWKWPVVSKWFRSPRTTGRKTQRGEQLDGWRDQCEPRHDSLPPLPPLQEEHAAGGGVMTAPGTESVLLTALAFARQGHAVFPVNWPIAHNGRLLCSCGSDSRGRPCGKNAAKHPYGKLAPNGLLSATTESGIVKHWFGYLAPQANLGVQTDKLIVIDID